MKLAIVYDWIDKWGGAERILNVLFEGFPKADIYTLYYDGKRAVWAKPYAKRIKTSFLQKIYKIIPIKKYLTPLMPIAAESFIFNSYDSVLSVSSSFVKGVLTRPETKHLSYIFAPTRFLWHEQQSYFKRPWLGTHIALSFLRKWDFIAATRPDNILTLSKYSQANIKHVYRRSSTVLPPPFDLEYFKRLKQKDRRPAGFAHKDYFLFLGRLEPYKKVDLLIRAFKKASGHKLVVVGQGSAKSSLLQAAFGAKNIFFYENIQEAELAYVYKHSKALIMPQSEDFGYTALEALFFGRPVVSFGKSGTAEIIQDGVNGILFFEQSVEAIITVLEKIHTLSYNIKDSFFAEFSKESFLSRLKKHL